MHVSWNSRGFLQLNLHKFLTCLINEVRCVCMLKAFHWGLFCLLMIRTMLQFILWGYTKIYLPNFFFKNVKLSNCLLLFVQKNNHLLNIHGDVIWVFLIICLLDQIDNLLRLTYSTFYCVLCTCLGLALPRSWSWLNSGSHFFCFKILKNCFTESFIWLP